MATSMEVERESVKLSLTNDLTKTAHLQSIKAHKHDQPFLTNNTKKHGSSSSSSSMEVSIFAFKGSWEEDDWFNDELFGETDVDRKLFKSMCRIGENRLAKVNAASQNKFQHLLSNSTFKSELEKAVKEGKKILFTGHSYSGAIASLATLWMLDEYVKKRGERFAIGCVTFGSPLIGDRTMSLAVRREKWSGHFTHFVREHDVVPRIMLAPKISIREHLPNILKFYQQKLNPIDHNKPHKILKPFKKSSPKNSMDQDPVIGVDEGVEFFKNVMMNASTVVSHVAFELMEPTNSLMEKLSVDFVKVSPYRPSGFYVFCTSDSQQFVVENPNAVLQLLFYFLQLPNENENLADFATKSLTESFSYEQVQSENLVDLKDLKGDMLTSNGAVGDAVRSCNTSLSDLSASARCCILAAYEAENRKKENEKELDKSLRRYRAGPTSKTIEDMLDEMRKYKEANPDYYKAFKAHDDQKDFQANMNRLEFAKIFDVVVEMVMRDDLPDEFEGRKEWVDVGTAFRWLVEPLDIANYYRHLKGDSYMKVRPKRYKFTQRWYEHANGTPFEIVSESNFVAELEEIEKEVEKTKKKTLEKVKEEMESLVIQKEKWFSDIQNDDVYWAESLFSVLQQKLQ